MKKITLLALCAGSWVLPVVSSAVAQGRGPADDRFDGGPPRREPRFGDGPGFGGRRGPGGPAGGKEKGELRRLWRGIDRLEESSSPLSKAQSKRVVALVLPWSKRPQMTEAEAGKLNQSLLAVLIRAQRNTLDDGPRGMGRRPGPPAGLPREGPPREGGRFDGPPPENGPREREPRGGGPEDGPRRGPGGRGQRGDGPFGGGPFGRGAGGEQLSSAQRQTVRAWMQNSNPFYAPTGTATWKSLPVEFQKDVARRYGRNRATLEAISRRSR